jgi:hypothetical protein
LERGHAVVDLYFIPNREAELGLVLMFASMIPIHGPAVRKRTFVLRDLFSA